MYALKLIHVDGTEEDLDRQVDHLSLGQLVKSGTQHPYFEFVAMREYQGRKQNAKYEVGGHIMAVNEMGLLLGLEPNHKAMDILGYWRDVSETPIVGDVVILRNEEVDFA